MAYRLSRRQTAERGFQCGGNDTLVCYPVEGGGQFCCCSSGFGSCYPPKIRSRPAARLRGMGLHPAMLAASVLQRNVTRHRRPRRRRRAQPQARDCKCSSWHWVFGVPFCIAWHCPKPGGAYGEPELAESYRPIP